MAADGIASGAPLSTPFSRYLKDTYNLPLPARFYDSRTLKPIASITLADVQRQAEAATASESVTGQQVTSPLVALFESGDSNLSADDIAAAFILDNAPSSGSGSARRNVQEVVNVMREFGTELLTRFGIETIYSQYSIAQLEANRSYWESSLRARKDFERILSDGIEDANAKVEAFPTSLLARPEVQRSNLVFSRVSWNAEKVTQSKIRDRDTTIQPIGDKVRLTNEDGPDIFSLIPVTGEIGGIPYLGYHTPVSNQYRVATTPPTASCSTQAMLAESGSSVSPATAAGSSAADRGCAIHPEKDEYTYHVITNSDLYSDVKSSTGFLSFMLRGVFCLLDLSRSSLILNNVSREAEQSLTSQVINLLDFLRIEGLTHNRITARIISPLGGSIAYHVLFFDAMLNQADYIGFKEEDKPQFMKPTKTFYLSPIPYIVNPMTDEIAFVRGIRIDMSNRTAANTELVTLDGGGAPYELARGTSYVEFTLFNVIDSDMLKFSMTYLSHLVGRYHKIAAIEYAPFIAEEFNLPVTSITSGATTDAVYARTSSSIRVIDIISHSYPEVFGHNFTRQCPHYPQVKQQLEAGDVEYVPRATGEEPKESDTGGSNEWLRYPPDGGIEFYFRCGIDEPEFSRPGVTVSKLKNKKKYPVIPCCFRSSQFRPGHHTEVAYRLGSASASAVSTIDITMSSWGPLNFPPAYNKRLLMAPDKTLFRGRVGRLPDKLASIITSHILPKSSGATCPAADEDNLSGGDDSPVGCEEDGESDIERRLVRLGLSETTMIHAAFLAADPAYQKLATATVDVRMTYIRSHIRIPQPACLYQELTAGEATRDALMRDPTFSNWTTATHFRILEESLDINLYVIIRITPHENTIEPDSYFFEIPSTRTGAPHARRHSASRPSVILYRVRRFEGDTIVDAGVELLLHGTQLTQFSALWGSACSSRIASLYSQADQVLSFGTSPINPSAYGSYVGLNTADYSSLLDKSKYEAVSQLIDERGLCRALTFRERIVRQDSAGGQLSRTAAFSIVFPATQPYNLPFSAILHTSNYELVVRRIFGDACLTSMVRDGVFYVLGDDPTRYVFIPVSAGDLTLPADMPFTSYTPLTGIDLNSVGYSTQWRTAHTYLRVLLYLVAFLFTFTEVRDPTNFMETRVTLDISRHASHASDIYDFSGLKRIIVLREPTMTEALATIKRLAPTFLDTRGEKIVVTSQKIYDGLAYYVRTVHDQTVATPISILRKRRWDLAKVVAPPREGGGSATLLLARPNKDSTREESLVSTLNFGSAKAVKTWFRGIRSGATSGGMILSKDMRAVTDTVNSGSGVVLWRHPKTMRVWLIPGVTYYLSEAMIVCYLWATKHRIVELESHRVTTTAVERQAITSGGQVPIPGQQRGGSRVTALFRPRTSAALDGRRSSRSRGGRLIIGGEEEDGEENFSALKNLIDSADITVLYYGITRDNHIELLTTRPEDASTARKNSDTKSSTRDTIRLTIEVLRTAENRYTPMLSP